MSCQARVSAPVNFASFFDSSFRQVVGATLLTLMAACSSDDSPSPEPNQELILFGEHVQSCRATACQEAFPVNQKCKKALEMIKEGRPKVEGQDQYVRYLQARISFSDTYADWLEGEAGKSMMGREYCKVKLKFIDNKMDLGGE